ncbi:MAG TPA: NAD(P)H-dependent oxidoreductase [Candidatus Thalassarchaeaceae archaeon]|nr:MAG TPA: NAD(P)H-dependent oxidoreductase [Candidatus Poseidoniales archaeon]HIH80607.1 NAD(P)H-dependent oxidoreductase [Candidatus Thalassarchaeaceae archaeon]|tara:strand:- start:11667 stop:12212 length:546 start_codon:yes stop_codon:yes gene_type:complete
MADPVVIMGICGSYDLNSANGRLLDIVLNHCKSLGAITCIWNNGEHPLPLVGEEGCWSHPNVDEYKIMADSADAFVLSSPEYHGTMSGVMKNNLDWLSSKQTTGKVFGLMSTLGGQSSNNTLNHMRIAARWIHGWVVPEQVAVANIKHAFDDEGNILDEVVGERVTALAESLVLNTAKLRR